MGHRLARRAVAVAALGLLGCGAGDDRRSPGSITILADSLDNGLRFVLAVDRTLPVVSVELRYGVGSRHERPGQAGYAHLFEHLMFRGSENVADGEHYALVEAAGGRANAATFPDYTTYFMTLPANQLPLGLWLEADRMSGLAIDDEDLETQRRVVLEERSILTSRQVSWAVAEAASAPFDAERCFGYAHDVQGDPADLNRATVEDARAFFRTHYTPDNALLAVVGDFEPGDVRRQIAEFFGSVPRGADRPTPPACERNPAPPLEPSVRPVHGLDGEGVAVVYRVPGRIEGRDPVAEIGRWVIARRLVDSAAARGLPRSTFQTSLLLWREAGVLRISSTEPGPGGPTGASEAALAAVRSVAHQPPDEAELRRARLSLRTQEAFAMLESRAIASALLDSWDVGAALEPPSARLGRYEEPDAEGVARWVDDFTRAGPPAVVRFVPVVSEGADGR